METQFVEAIVVGDIARVREMLTESQKFYFECKEHGKCVQCPKGVNRPWGWICKAFDVSVSVREKHEQPHEVSSLHLACLCGHVEIVALLLSRRTDFINSEMPVTPLVMASRCSDRVAMLQIATLLLRSGANVDKVDAGTCYNLLHMAVTLDKEEAVQLLVAKGCKAHEFLKLALGKQCFKPLVDGVKFLNDDPALCLFAYVLSIGDIESAIMMSKAKTFDIGHRYPGTTFVNVLSIGITASNMRKDKDKFAEFFNCLLQLAKDVCKQRSYYAPAVCALLKHDKPDLLKQLLSAVGEESRKKSTLSGGGKGDDMESDGGTATKAESTQPALDKLCCNVEIEAKYTPLTWAITNRATECVKILISHGADTRLVDEGHRSPLYCAIKSGYLAVDSVKYLLERNASVAPCSLPGMPETSLLYFALSEMNFRAADLLTSYLDMNKERWLLDVANLPRVLQEQPAMYSHFLKLFNQPVNLCHLCKVAVRSVMATTDFSADKKVLAPSPNFYWI